MKLWVGSDHGGFKSKEKLVGVLRQEGHTVTDIGTFSEESMDYPDIAKLVCLAVTGKKADRGILLCGTGIGMSIAANKMKGIRAAVVWNKPTASLAARHNKANVLCLGGRVLKPSTLIELARVWIRSPFERGRHVRRISKITALETKKRG
ncbi:MAG: ribose 5-phosphate isomerase B [Elusimicrobia bacterium]|jgi:ribose 5-phosphate isomerase B|nr:ribose 5-phosphate isomerase B [Elusimicrobiota bacterium]